MGIKAVLFDLDGTLLPMDLNIFAERYVSELARKFVPLGYEPKRLAEAVWGGVGVMVGNDGSRTNSEAFWDAFVKNYGTKALEDSAVFDEFYEKDFEKIRDCCGFNPEAGKAVSEIKAMGYRVALATNPIFPGVATKARIRWAGLEPEDFEDFTAFETAHYCKPNPKYYLEFTKKLGLLPEECLMVGNDVTEDMIAETLGMKVFLITNDLINRHGKDISGYPQGDFKDLLEYIKTI